MKDQVMMRFGVCGCGAFAEKAFLPILANVDQAKATAVFDAKDKNRQKQLQTQFNIPRGCDSFESLIEGDDIDVVYIATPNVFHKELVISAARASKHILCEKPLGMNTNQCREMVDQCRQHNVKLGVDFCYPFGDAQRKVKELIKQGAIGKISFIHFSWSFLADVTNNWHGDAKISGGGPLMDVAPHIIDLARFYFEDDIESVSAYVRPEKTDAEIEMDAAAVLEFSQGARATIETSFVRQNKHNYTIVGTKGELHAVGTMAWQGTKGRVVLRTGLQETDISFGEIHGLQRMLGLFCQAIPQDQPLPVDGRAGLYAQAAIDAIYESGRTGKRQAVSV